MGYFGFVRLGSQTENGYKIWQFLNIVYTCFRPIEVSRQAHNLSYDRVFSQPSPIIFYSHLNFALISF